MHFPYFILNAKLRPTSEAAIMISDVGLLRGYGIFDFFPIKGGKAVFQTDYFDRFYRSAHALNLDVPIEREQLARQIAQLAAENGEGEGYLKLVLTGGNSADGFTPGASNLLLIQHPEVFYPASYFEQGISLVLQKYERPAPEVKSLNYSNAIRCRDLLDARSAIDILYHDGRQVHETSRANFFIVDQDGSLCTADDELLMGVTRKQVLDLAADVMPVQVGALSLAQVACAQEAFITSTTKHVMPVTKLNAWEIAGKTVGPVTKRLMTLFQKHLQEQGI